MDLYEEMGYVKKKVPQAVVPLKTKDEYLDESNYPEFEVDIRPGDPDYELAKTDPVAYSKNVLAEKDTIAPTAAAEPAAKPAPAKKEGGVDLFSEMYGAGAKKPLRVKSSAQTAPKKEGLLEGLVVPTGEAALRVGGALAGSLVTGTGAIATHVPYMVKDIGEELLKGKSFKEAFKAGATTASNRSIQTMEFPAKELLKTPEQQESFENIMIPLGAAGAGWRGIAEYAATGDIQKASDVVQGKSMGSSVAVPIAGAFGDTAFIYALMGKNAVKARWYQMTIKERALVSKAAQEVKANINDSKLTNAQVRELWKDPANREGLIRRFAMGETEEVAARPTSKPPTQASGVTEQPVVGFEKGKVHPLADMMNILPESETLGLAGAKGEGFTVKPAPTGVIKRGNYIEGEVPEKLDVEYKPFISKNGRPFATEEYAEKVALERGFNPQEFEVVPVEVGKYKGFGYVRLTPIKQKLPIPGQESLGKTLLREIISEKKALQPEVPVGQLDRPVEVTLPKPMELSNFDQMKLKTLRETDPALWNASDKVFMQKLGEAIPKSIPVENAVIAPEEIYAGPREETIGKTKGFKTKAKPSVKPATEEPAFKINDKRAFKDILKDINKAFGEKGELGKEVEVSAETLEARARLKDDLAKFSEAAKREGKDVEQYLKDSGVSGEALVALTRMSREVGDTAKQKWFSLKDEDSPITLLEKQIKADYPGTDVNLSPYINTNHFRVNTLDIPKSARNKGVGTDIMNRFKSFADEHNLTFDLFASKTQNAREWFAKDPSHRGLTEKSTGVYEYTPKTKVGDVSKIDTGRGVEAKKSTAVIEKETINAGADLTTIKARQLKDMLGYSPIRTVVGELLQNSLDATRDTGGKIFVKTADNKVTVIDHGTGMTPEIMRDNFVTLGGQGTKGAEDMGGFGLAKLPIMGWPESVDVVSIANTPSGKVKSHIWTTSEEYMKKHTVNFEESKVSDKELTGTTIEITKDGIRPHEVDYVIKNLVENMRTPQEIVVKRADYDPISYKGTPLSEAKTKYDVEKFTLPGGTEATVKFTTTEPYGWQEPYKVEVLVYNKGLLLPDIPKYSNFDFRLSKKPDFKVEIDFTRTPPASDVENYPFLVNRTRLSEGALDNIREIVNRRILDVEANITKTNIASLRELFQNAPEFAGTKLIIPLKEENLRNDIANIIYNNPEPYIKLGKLFSNFSKIIAKVPNIKIHEFAITTEQTVHGFRPKSGLLPKDYIVINPFSYLEALDKKYNVYPKTMLREEATALTDTMTHEAAHNNVPGHYGDYVKEFHRITKSIGHKKLSELEKEAYEIFRLHGEDITRATRDIRDIQSEGTIAELFSDYSPETQRVNETGRREGYPVHAQRVGDVGAKAEGNLSESLGKEAESRAQLALETPKPKEGLRLKPTAAQRAKDILTGERGSIPLGEKKPFYSKLEEVINSKMRMSMTVDQLRKTALNNGVTVDEFNDVFKGVKGTITKKQALDELAVNGVKFEDVVLGEKTPDKWVEYTEANGNTFKAQASEAGILKPTQFEGYSEPGYVPGSYRELFVTAPKTSVLPKDMLKIEYYEKLSDKELAKEYVEIFGSDPPDSRLDTLKIIRNSLSDMGSWQDGHGAYSDIKNPIVRLRLNERDVNGKRVLFIEEMQGPSAANQANMPESLRNRIYDIGVKKAIQYAKENGFDEIAWTTGEMQAKRYDLSKHIDQITYWKNADGSYDLRTDLKNGDSISTKHPLTVNDLPEYIGKEATKLILSDKYTAPKGKYGLRSGGRLENLDLKVGGEGLKRLYNETIPGLMEKYSGGKKRTTAINELKEVNEASLQDLEHKLRAKAQQMRDILKPGEALSLDLLADRIATNTPISEEFLKHYVHPEAVREYRNILKEVSGEHVEAQAIPITEKTPSSFTLYEGVDPTQTVAVLKGLAKNTKEAYQYLSEVGQRIYSSGKTEFFSWRNEFRTALGELWEQYKNQVMAVWNKLKTGVLKPLMNERGSVGYDTAGERIAKQRDLGTLEDGTKLKAPAISEKEFRLLRSLPDMTKKPLAGFVQNPIYTFEDWAASVGPKAQTWVKEKFYYPIREATHRADLHFKNIFDQVEARRKELPHSSSRRIYYHAISKETGGAEILKNMGIKEVPELTKGEMETYNWMRSGYESMYKQINAARIASGIEPIAKVKDYFTFAADMTLAEELGFGFNDAMLGKFVHPKATKFRYAIERIGGIQKVHTDGFGIFERYMKSATKHIYLSPEISKMREFTGKFDLGEGKFWSMKDKQPRAYRTITKYLDFLTGERMSILPDALERSMVMLNKNITTATLSSNFRSALIQPTALHNTYIEIGPKYTAKGAIDLMLGKGDEAINKSKVLFNREFDVDIKQTYDGVFGRIGSMKKAINDSWLGMKPLKYLDMQTATTTWLGAFEKAKTVYKMSEENAVRYADDTVIRTQGSAAAHDLAPIQRIALGRFFSTFQSFVINNFNFLAKDVLGIKNPMLKPAESLHRVGRYVLGAVIINTIFEDLLGINSPLPAPIRAAKKTYDKNNDAKEAALSAALEFLQVVPGFGGLRYGSGMTGAGIDYLKDVTNKLAEEAGEYRGKTKSWGELAGKAAGIPGTGQITKTMKILDKGGTLPEAILGRYPETSKNILLDMKKDSSFNFDKL